MSNYLCQNCKNNNNGWCNAKKMNGLKKKNITKCEEYKGDETIFKVSRSKDCFEVEHLTIEIDDVGVIIPTHVITDFLNSKGKNIKVSIPN